MKFRERKNKITTICIMIQDKDFSIMIQGMDGRIEGTML